MGAWMTHSPDCPHEKPPRVLERIPQRDGSVVWLITCPDCGMRASVVRTPESARERAENRGDAWERQRGLGRPEEVGS